MVAKRIERGKESGGDLTAVVAGKPERIANKLENKLIKEDTSKTGLQNFLDKLKTKKYISISLIIVVLALAGVFYMFAKSRSSQKQAESYASCDYRTELFSKIHKMNLSGIFTGNAEKDIGKLTSIKDFGTSPNCLFVVVEYYATTLKVKEAEQYYNKLKELEDDNISPVLLKNIYDEPEEYLGKKISFAKKQQKEFEGSYIGVGAKGEN